MSRYLDQVAAALQAVTIRGPTRYSWLGRASRPLRAELEAEMDQTECRNFLVSCLTEELYRSFYCRGGLVPARWEGPEPVEADPWLAAALSNANVGSGSWERGWTVERLEDGDAVVASSLVRARIPTAHCRASAGVRPGAAVSVRLPKELPSLSPGFYTAVGDAPADSGSRPIVRAYWHVTRTGAPALVQALTSRLNAAGVPFQLKVADHPRRLERCDAAVLYVPGEVFRAQRETFLDVASGLTGYLRPRIPAFTLELTTGVGLAEDDGGGGESFGTRRCTLLAEAIVRAHAQGLTRLRARVDAVAARFAEEGVRIEAPYREPSLAGRHVL
jgi:HopA1 effector protein family